MDEVVLDVDSIGASTVASLLLRLFTVLFPAAVVYSCDSLLFLKSTIQTVSTLTMGTLDFVAIP